MSVSIQYLVGKRSEALIVGLGGLFQNMNMPRQIPEPTLASGTSPAGQETRHRWRGSLGRSAEKL
jgi:hypothetical protein